MRIVIATGMVIVFICTFFVLFIAENIMKTHFECSGSDGGVVCSIRSTGPEIFMPLSFIALFIIIASTCVYIVIKAVRESVDYTFISK